MAKKKKKKKKGGVLHIPQNSSITGTSPSDCLVSYPGHSLGWFYPSAEINQLGKGNMEYPSIYESNRMFDI